MFSEALRILEHNTMMYLVEQQQKELEEKDLVISEKDAEISALKKQLEALTSK